MLMVLAFNLSNHALEWERASQWSDGGISRFLCLSSLISPLIPFSSPNLWTFWMSLLSMVVWCTFITVTNSINGITSISYIYRWREGRLRNENFNNYEVHFTSFADCIEFFPASFFSLAGQKGYGKVKWCRSGCSDAGPPNAVMQAHRCCVLQCRTETLLGKVGALLGKINVIGCICGPSL